MQKGTLNEQALERTVLRSIHKRNVKSGQISGVGNDYSNIEKIITSDGVGDSPYVAYCKAENNFVCSGGMCLGMRLTLLFPEGTKEAKLRSVMEKFEELSEQRRVPIIGGHTEISDSFENAFFIVTLIGKENGYSPRKKDIREGYDIVMTGYTGTLGNNSLLERKRDELRIRFSEDFLEKAYMNVSAYSLYETGRVIYENSLWEKCHICYLHDVSQGGIYTALWQIGKWMNKGIRIWNSKLQLRQETIEICEFLNKNPYFIDGTGGLLLVCENGKELVNTFRENGIVAERIGTVTKEKERLVEISPSDIRTLVPDNREELFV